MNIKSRINKLEELTCAKSRFCGCRETNKRETYFQELTSDFVEKNEPRLTGEAVPEVCPVCKRKIEKKVIIIQGVESKIPKPDAIKSKH